MTFLFNSTNAFHGVAGRRFLIKPRHNRLDTDIVAVDPLVPVKHQPEPRTGQGVVFAVIGGYVVGLVLDKVQPVDCLARNVTVTVTVGS